MPMVGFADGSTLCDGRKLKFSVVGASRRVWLFLIV